MEGINATVLINKKGKIINSSLEKVNVIRFDKVFLTDCLTDADIFTNGEMERIRSGFELVTSGERRQFSVKKYLGQGKYFRVRAQAMKKPKVVSVAVRVGDDDLVEQIQHHFRNPLLTIRKMAIAILQQSRTLDDILENANTYQMIKKGRYSAIDPDENFDLYSVIKEAKSYVSFDVDEADIDVHHKYSIRKGQVSDLSTNKRCLQYVYKWGLINAIELGFPGARLSWGFQEHKNPEFIKLMIYSHTNRFISEEEANDMFKDRGFYLDDDLDIDSPELKREAMQLRLYNMKKLIELQGGKMWIETGYDVKKDNTPYLKLYFTVKKSEEPVKPIAEHQYEFEFKDRKEEHEQDLNTPSNN